MKSAIVSNDEIHSVISKKLQQIVLAVEQDYDKISDFSLLCGKTGVAVFLFNYFRFSGDDRSEVLAHKMLERSLEEIAETKILDPSHCNGLSGVAWCFDYLKAEEYIYDDAKTVFGDSIYDALLKQANGMLVRGNYDYLHGAGGILLYLLDAGVDIEESIELLIKLGVESDEHFKWRSWQTDLEGWDCYNMSLAHGQVSVLHLLLKAYARKPNDRWRLVVEKIVRFILFTRIEDAAAARSVFPNFVTIPGQPEVKTSRLAWCYGDLGVANVLYNASKVLNDHTLEYYSVEVISKCALRKSFEESFVSDVFFCHGSAGNMHFFESLYHKHNNIVHKEAALFWMNYTLQNGNNIDGLAGFELNQTRSYQNPYALLEGITGVGLSLLSTITGHPNTWNKFFSL